MGDVPVSEGLRRSVKEAVGPHGIWWSGWKDDDGLEDCVAEVEALGYGAFWMSGGFRPGVSPRFGRVLSSTTSLVVASGIIGVFLNDPVELASAAAELEASAAGRFLLGLGVSHAHVVEASGQPYDHPYSKMVGFLDEMDAALAANPAASPTAGGDARTTPRILAALGPRMLRLAASRSVGAHPYFVPTDHTRSAREMLGEGPLLAPELAAVIETDPARAREAARGYAARYLAAPNYAGNLRRFGFDDADFAEGGSDRLIDAVIAHGDVGAVAARVTEHLDAGADHVCIQIVEEGGRFPMAAYRELAAAL